MAQKRNSGLKANYYIEEAILIADIKSNQKKKLNISVSLDQAYKHLLKKSCSKLLEDLGDFKVGKFCNMMTDIIIKKKSDPEYVLKIKIAIDERRLNQKTPLEYWSQVCSKINKRFNTSQELLFLLKKTV